MKKISLLLILCCLGCFGIHGQASETTSFHEALSKKASPSFRVGLLAEHIFSLKSRDLSGVNKDPENLHKISRNYKGVSLEVEPIEKLTLLTWLGVARYDLSAQGRDEWVSQHGKIMCEKRTSRSDFAYALGAKWTFLDSENYDLQLSSMYFRSKSLLKKDVIKSQSGRATFEDISSERVWVGEDKFNIDLVSHFKQMPIKPFMGISVNHLLVNFKGDAISDEPEMSLSLKGKRRLGLICGLEVPSIERVKFCLEGRLLSESSIRLKGEYSF